MKSLRKALTVALASLVVIGMFAGCAKKDEEVKVIRYLNFKPEIDDIYEEI